jgi:hypothetical protein
MLAIMRQLLFAVCALQGWHRSKLTSGKGRGLHANLQRTSSSSRGQPPISTVSTSL